MKMDMASVWRLTKVLRVFIIALFILNLIALLLVPGLLFYSYDPFTGEWIGVEDGLRHFVDLWNYEADDAMAWWLYAGFFYNLESPQTTVTMLFLLFCGSCSAVMLWQAKRVLETILLEDPFSRKNAANMVRAAVCCFAISTAALIRLIWSAAYYKSTMPLISYNTLFIPVFLVAGLVCLVMSALFRQAAELKEENDLTI